MGNLKNMELLIKYIKYINNNKVVKVKYNNILIGYAKQMILNDY